MASAVDQWLREHGAGERRLAKMFDRFFSDQTSRVAKALGRLRSPSVDDVADLLDIDEETESLWKVLAMPLAGLAATGAFRVLEQAKKRRRRNRKDAPDFEGPLETMDLSESMKATIQATLDKLAAQRYWTDIQATTADNVAKIVKLGISDGLSGSELAKKLRESLGQTQRWRARAIARTETGMCMNAGHQAAMESMADDDIVEGKTWLAILDNDTRQTHADPNETTVKVNKNFSVGGYSAPYPCHWSLPAAERVHCRCVVISKFRDD